MKPFLRIALPLFALSAVVAACSDLASLKKKIVSFTASELVWIEIPDSGGIRYANVRGDLAGDGPYEAFVLFPAGKDNPYHYHTRSIPTVVLKGTFYVVIDGQRTEYPAGSFYDLPGHLKHFSGCADGVDCLLFQYQDRGFDLVPQREGNEAHLMKSERAPAGARSISTLENATANCAGKATERVATARLSKVPAQQAQAPHRPLWPFRSSAPAGPSSCATRGSAPQTPPASPAWFPDAP